MKRTILCGAGILALAASTFLPGPAQADEDNLVTYQALTPELAVSLAQSALGACREKGFQVAVAVVDRGGLLQAFVRDRFAGPHTPDTAAGKAWTAISFRSNTRDLIAPTSSGQPQSGARHIPGTVMLGGGVVIEAGGALIGGIGVSGAPTGEDDESCAKAGLEAIADRLPL